MKFFLLFVENIIAHDRVRILAKEEIMSLQVAKVTPKVMKRVIGLVSGTIPSKKSTTPERLMMKFIAPFLFPGGTEGALKVHVQEWQIAEKATHAITLLSEVTAFARSLPDEFNEVKTILSNLANSKNPTAELEKAVVSAATRSALPKEQTALILASQPKFTDITTMCESIDIPTRYLKQLSGPIVPLSVLGKVFAILGNNNMALKLFKKAITWAKKESTRNIWPSTISGYIPRESAFRIIIQNMFAAGLAKESIEVAAKNRTHARRPLYDEELKLLELIIEGKAVSESVGEELSKEYRYDKIGAFKYLADALIQQGRIEEALLLFRKACATEGSNNSPTTSLGIALMLFKTPQVTKELALLAKVNKEKQEWEKGVARARLKDQDRATQEQVISDFIWGGVSQSPISRASTSNVPKLLFHGTAAFAAWCSYWNSINFVRESSRQSLSAELLARVEKFGPLYPAFYMGQSNVCLVADIDVAYHFSWHWNILVEPNIVRMKAQTSKVTLFDNFRKPGTDPQVTQVFDQLIRNSDHRQKKVSSPGAILLVDGPKLAENKLFAPPRGEELVIAKYLPWSFIRGMLLVDHHAWQEMPEKKVTAHTFFDDEVGTDLLDYLRNKTPGRPMFVAEGMHWAIR